MANQTEVEKVLCEFYRENLLAGNVYFDAQSSLYELGIDSAALVETLLFVERRFGVMLPESSLSHQNVETIASLASCIVSEMEKDSPAGPDSAQ
ncbi:MAG: acyl carrier protein [Candidatus Sumerlaeia bacterium]